MDVILEIFDTFLFDRLYAEFLPVVPPPSFQKPFANVTYSRLQEAPNGFHYKPSTQYFALEPSAAAYNSRLPRDSAWRQSISLYLITWLFGLVIYFAMAGLSYVFIFDKTTVKHPKFPTNQITMEIACTMRALPVMAIFTVAFFLAEVCGYSKMYDTSAEGPGLWYDILQFPLFIAFTGFLIYWIHRGLHRPKIYKNLHKAHHKWVVPTLFASHAFHPLDGYAQSLPYHIFSFLFPLQKFAYVALFVFINVWTVMIHDGEYATNSQVINGAACHTMHHLYFHYDYGQFTTLWDRLGGSYRKPNDELFDRGEKMSTKEWERQNMETEKILHDYDPDELLKERREAKKLR